MTYSTTAKHYLGESVHEKDLQRAQERTVRLGGHLEVRPRGYCLELKTRRALVTQWRHVLRILSDAEGGTA